MVKEGVFCCICGKKIEKDIECVDFSSGDASFLSIRVKVVEDGHEKEMCPECARKILQNEVPEVEDIEGSTNG